MGVKKWGSVLIRARESRENAAACFYKEMKGGGIRRGAFKEKRAVGEQDAMPLHSLDLVTSSGL